MLQPSADKCRQNQTQSLPVILQSTAFLSQKLVVSLKKYEATGNPTIWRTSKYISWEYFRTA